MNMKWLKLSSDINQSQSLSKSFLISCTTRMAFTLLPTARYSLNSRPRIPNLLFRMAQKTSTTLSWLSAMVKKKAKNSGMSKTHGLILGAIMDISESKEASTCAVLLNAHLLLLFNRTLNYKLSRFPRTSPPSLDRLEDTDLGTTLNFSKMLSHWNKFSNTSVSVFIYIICMIINYVVNNNIRSITRPMFQVRRPIYPCLVDRRSGRG